MRATIKKVTVWRKEVGNRSGALAELLQPLAEAGADLQAVIVYASLGDETSRRAVSGIGKDTPNRHRPPVWPQPRFRSCLCRRQSSGDYCRSWLIRFKCDFERVQKHET